MGERGRHSVTSPTHVVGGMLFTTAGLGAANAAGWMHAPGWALAIGIAWGAIAGELPDIDHRKARVSRTGVAFGVAGRLLGVPARIVGVFIRGLRVTHRGPTHSLTFLAVCRPDEYVDRCLAGLRSCCKLRASIRGRST
jgi:membrane-bound metal-dependent hydrolase YbcI (DUF457 family)